MQIASNVHRQYPVPDRPWILHQTWNHILFAHWPVPPSLLASKIPNGLALDTFDGYAWIGLLPFSVSDLHPQNMPPIPGIRTFAEANLRTYVSKGDRPGVFFFSLDANNPLAVAMARRVFHLPYYRAQIDVNEADGRTSFVLTRIHRNQPEHKVNCLYQPISPGFESTKGSLESWLTDRYCLYTAHSGRLYRGDIHHDAWTLHIAETEFTSNTLLTGYVKNVLSPPILHFSEQKQVRIWSFVSDN